MATTTNPDSVTKDAASAMAMLLKTSKYSDLIIRCRDYIFKVHRSVILSRSTPLAAAMDGNFKESETGEIDLSEDEPFVVGRLVEFLYTGNFDVDSMRVTHASVSKRKSTATDSPVPKGATRSSTGESTLVQPSNGSILGSTAATPSISELLAASKPPPLENPPSGPLITIAKVYVIAETFMVPALKDLSRTKYEKTVTDNWNSPAFAESVRLLYENTPETVRDIKDVAVKTARTNIKALLDRGEFRTLLKDIGEFGLDVLQLATDIPREEPKPPTNVAAKCGHCQSSFSCPSSSSHVKITSQSSWHCATAHCGYSASGNDKLYCRYCRTYNTFVVVE